MRERHRGTFCGRKDSRQHAKVATCTRHGTKDLASHCISLIHKYVGPNGTKSQAQELGGGGDCSALKTLGAASS